MKQRRSRPENLSCPVAEHGLCAAIESHHGIDRLLDQFVTNVADLAAKHDGWRLCPQLERKGMGARSNVNGLKSSDLGVER